MWEWFKSMIRTSRTSKPSKVGLWQLSNGTVLTPVTMYYFTIPIPMSSTAPVLLELVVAKLLSVVGCICDHPVEIVSCDCVAIPPCC